MKILSSLKRIRKITKKRLKLRSEGGQNERLIHWTIVKILLAKGRIMEGNDASIFWIVFIIYNII